MTTLEILRILQQDIHSAVFATLDETGLPQTCVIDLMLSDETGLYFLTAKGKSFYRRLTAKPYVALSGMKGADTLSSVAISLQGPVRNIGKERLGEIFEKNPYMAKIYPTQRSREALEVFQIYQGEGEYFDLSQQPPFRQSFSFGGETVHPAGYRICGADEARTMRFGPSRSRILRMLSRIVVPRTMESSITTSVSRPRRTVP